MEGLRDFYIGIPEMEINALEKQYYPYSAYISIEKVIESFVDIITDIKNKPDLKDSLFEEGLAILQEVAKRDHVSDDELQAAIQKYHEMCGR